jgi:hypothetical protein
VLNLNDAVAPDAGAAVVGGAPDASESLWWLLLTPLLPAIVALPFCRWLLPLVAPLSVYAALVRRIRERRYLAAWTLGMLWALLLSAGFIALTLLRPGLAAGGILHGPQYKEEMQHWIVDGQGKETSPAQFLPEHAIHLGAFLVLTLGSGGYLGLALGAGMLGYMDFYVGSYAARTGIGGGLAAWAPWAVLRVMSFMLFLVVLARPLIVRRSDPAWLRLGAREWRLLAVALAGVIADAALKAALAPWWGGFLHRILAAHAP